MTDSPTRPDGTLRELTEAECWSHLRDGVVGHLAYLDVDGPTIVPLNYVTHEGDVWVRTSSSTTMAIHLPGQRTAFTLGHTDKHDRSGWSVLVRGRAELVHDDDRSTPPGWAESAPWPDGTRSMTFCVTPTSVTGRLLRSRDVTPQAGRRPGTVQRHTVEAASRPAGG